MQIKVCFYWGFDCNCCHVTSQDTWDTKVVFSLLSLYCHTLLFWPRNGLVRIACMSCWGEEQYTIVENTLIIQHIPFLSSITKRKHDKFCFIIPSFAHVNIKAHITTYTFDCREVFCRMICDLLPLRDQYVPTLNCFLCCLSLNSGGKQKQEVHCWHLGCVVLFAGVTP